MTIEIEVVDSPIGSVLMARRREAVVAVKFEDSRDRLERWLSRRFPVEEVVEARTESATGAALRRYFGGDVCALDEINVDPGGTPFQAAVWEALRRVPSGATVSYRDLAGMAGVANAVRAVGTAMGTNPIGIVIPCHRVIHSDGSISNYGGGVERKRWLLEHEGATVQAALV